MVAGSGKYFWVAVIFLVPSALVLLYSLSTGRPHYRAGGAPALDPVAIISAITTLLSTITALITAIDKFGKKGSEAKDTPEPTTDVGRRPTPRDPDEYVDYDEPRRSRRGGRYRRGQVVEFVRPDRNDDRYILVDVARFVRYNQEGKEVWDVFKRYREYDG